MLGDIYLLTDGTLLAGTSAHRKYRIWYLLHSARGSALVMKLIGSAHARAYLCSSLTVVSIVWRVIEHTCCVAVISERLHMLQGTGGRPLPWSSRSTSAGGCHQEGLFTRQLAIFSKAEAPAHFSWTNPYQGVCPELKVALGGLPNCRGNGWSC